MDSRIAKLADYLATYAQAISYKRTGYRVDDIIENMYANIMKLAEELDIVDIIESLINSIE